MSVMNFPCPTCSGPTRQTVGMVCQICGADYGTPAEDRAQPTQEVREAIAAAMAHYFGWPERHSYPLRVADAVLALPEVAALLDAQAAVEQRIELARIEGRAESLNAEVHEMEDDDDAQLLAVRAIQWEQEAEPLRRALDGTT